MAIRGRLSAVTAQSERTILVSTVLLASALSAATGYLLTQYYSIDVLSSLTYWPEDCWGAWGTNIGRHCFGDYSMVVGAATRADPWEPYAMLPPHAPLQMGFTAAVLPHLLFGLPAKWLGAPLLGLFGYQLALTIAVLSPAVWAARGARGIERVAVFVALGAAAIPAWGVIDRGNSAGFLVPIALVFLVALRRRRWGLATIMVVLAALVNPPFVVLAVALLAARQWRLGSLAVAGAVVVNLAAFLLWPREFPGSIARSIHNVLTASGDFSMLVDLRNVSFARGILFLPDYAELALSGGKIPDGFLAGPRSLIGYVLLILIVAAVLALGRRIPPVMVGIVLLATATLFPPLATYYHLIFVLPVAALIVREPEGPTGTGIFDQLAIQGGRRRAVGIWVSLAAALSIAQIALPGLIGYASIPGTGTRAFVLTTVFLTPFLWLIAVAVTLVSYARKPAPSPDSDQDPAEEDPLDAAVSTPSASPELMTEP
jgi:hypothetical protein